MAIFKICFRTSNRTLSGQRYFYTKILNAILASPLSAQAPTPALIVCSSIDKTQVASAYKAPTAPLASTVAFNLEPPTLA